MGVKGEPGSLGMQGLIGEKGDRGKIGQSGDRVSHIGACKIKNYSSATSSYVAASTRLFCDWMTSTPSSLIEVKDMKNEKFLY